MATYTMQPAIADTHIRSDATTTNYNAQASVGVGESNIAARVYRGLFKFDMSGIPSSGETVTSATLSLWTVSDLANNARTFRVYRVKRNWTHAGATWDTYDGTNNWGTAGCAAATDRDTTDIGSRSMSATESALTQCDFPLDTTAIQEMVSGAVSNYGFIVIADTESDDAYLFKSAEGGTPTNAQPLLTVVTTPTAAGNPNYYYQLINRRR